MSLVLHLFWHPAPGNEFLQSGEFRLWVETATANRGKTGGTHPRHLRAKPLAEWLQSVLGRELSQTVLPHRFESVELPFPSADGQPLPCPELLAGAGGE
jgi:hypothetical protein